MRLTILGLTLSHPYAFADYLAAQCHAIAAVWDYDRARADAFAATYGCTVAGSVEQALTIPADGVIITSYTADHFAHARLALEAGLPAYVDKLLTLSPEEAATLAAMRPVLMSGSALRYLPAVRELAAAVREGRIGIPLTARAEVYHGMRAYLQAGATWQDDPVLSGGVLMNMGVHAVDLLVAVLGPDWTVQGAERSRRVHAAALSEDQAALLLRGRGGELATVQVVCGTERHRYAVTVTGTEADARWQFPDPQRPLDGSLYGPMLEAFVEAIRTGERPVPAAEMVGAVRLLSAARAQARPAL